MYLSIKNVKPLDNYLLLLIFDIKPYLEIGKFKELKNKELFKSVKISFDTVEWDNQLDLDPELLYQKSLNKPHQKFSS